MVLICVVSLVMVSSITIALTPSINQMIRTAFSTGNIEENQSSDFVVVIHMLGETINDPKPN